MAIYAILAVQGAAIAALVLLVACRREGLLVTPPAPPAPAGLISGRVVDGTTHRPITEYEIQLNTDRSRRMRAGNGMVKLGTFLGSKAVRDANGAFVIDRLPVDTVTLRFVADGYLSAVTGPLTVPPAQPPFEIALDRGFRVTGCVMDTEGKPINGAMLSFREMLEPRMPRVPDALPITTREDGSFVFDGLDRGGMRLDVYHPAYAPAQYDLVVVDGPKENEIVTLSR